MKLITFILLISPIFMLEQNNANNSFIIRKYNSDTPSFPGGDDALYSYLKTETCRDFFATVGLKFRVRKNGKISRVRVIEHVNKVVGEKAKRIIKKMPRW